MSKLTPTLYLIGVFFVFLFAWYVGPEERLVNLAWALPGLFVGTFAVLWGAMVRLERKIAVLERQIESVKK